MRSKGDARMRIAICDDDYRDLHMLHTAIEQYDTIHNLEIASFTKAVDLFTANARTAFDIAILDIEMTSPNGYEIAQKLIEQDNAPIIIFLTNSTAYSIRGYGVAFRYLTKPIDQTQLRKALDAAICEVKANRFVFTTDGISHVIRMNDIYYFEVFNHYAVLHTMDKEYTFRATLKEISIDLPSGYFGSPHQSYLVNFVHVKTAMSKELHLTNGAVVPISRRRQQEFEDQLHAYLGR